MCSHWLVGISISIIFKIGKEKCCALGCDLADCEFFSLDFGISSNFCISGGPLLIISSNLLIAFFFALLRAVGFKAENSLKRTSYTLIQSSRRKFLVDKVVDENF